MTYNDALHPRGHASNAGAFSDKTQSAPEIGSLAAAADTSVFATEASRRTPEQIAEFVAWQTYFAKRKSDHERIVLTRNSFVSFLTAAVKAANREEQAAPSFKPDDEPDIYRDAWESLSDEEDGPNWIGQRVSELAPTNPELARRILELLSSASE